MTRRFTSTVAGAGERGEEFGSRYADEVAKTVATYERVFSANGRIDMDGLGDRALQRIESFSPDLAVEIRGIAGGSGLPARRVAAINARTEILAVARRTYGLASRGECSTVVALGEQQREQQREQPGAQSHKESHHQPGEQPREPVAVQTWDWYADLADNWLEWTIPFPDGRRVVTVTEFGILGKIGVNASGVGLLFNVLHHRDDGAGMGVPVHIIARHILDLAPNVHSGLRLAAAARTSASTAITLVGSCAAGKTAISTELWPGGPGHVLPTTDGLLLRTNHFLTDPARLGDQEPLTAPDTLVRLDVLRRRLHRYGGRAEVEQVLEAMDDHTGGLCCHPDPLSAPGPYYATLATVRVDVAAATLDTHAGGPCGWRHRPESAPR